MPSLRVTLAGKAPKVYHLYKKITSIGRGEENDVVLSDPRVLFEQRYAYGANTALANYDVSVDGRQFVMVKNDPGASHLNVVLNWFDELKQRAPMK